MSTPLLAILAGGRSHRMGRDKALLERDGRPQLVRLANLGATLGLPVVICGSPADPAWSGPPVRFLADGVPGEGPLRGLEAALGVHPDVLLIACDLPLVTAADLAWLRAAEPGIHGTATLRDGRIEPLFSRYRDCATLVAAELAAGRRSPLAVIAGGGFNRATAPPEIAARLADADTPEDWQQLAGT